MDNLSIFIQTFKPYLFWDVDVSELDPEASKRLIIQRVFTRGSLKDMQAVISNYGQNEVVEVLCTLNYLDPKTLNFVSKIFNTPKDKFSLDYSQRNLVVGKAEWKWGRKGTLVP